MNFFGFNIGGTKGMKSTDLKTIDVPKGDNFSTFSTSFGNIGGADLSKPYINANYLSSNGTIRFGTDNLFPQLVNQLYYTSPLNSSIIKLKVNASVGGGFEIINGGTAGASKVNEYTFIKKNKIKNKLKAITRNCIMHSAIYVCIHFKENGEPEKFELIPSEKVRLNPSKTLFEISNDWSTGIVDYTLTLYSAKNKARKQMFFMHLDCPGQDYYPISEFNNANNWMFLDGEMSYLQKSNIQNSIFPSFALMLPKIPASKAEEDKIKETLEKAKGASASGKAVVFAANGKDALPDLVPIPTNNNDKLFLQTDERIDLKISQAHQIDPLLAGIRTSGKLGSGTDIKQAYTIFEKNVIMPLRIEIEDFMNELMDIFNIQGEFKINNFQIIDDIIKQIEEK